ncbi:Mu transposase C-terminal domain-containing protein [Actinoplanes sp. NPDC051851]|uniref:Mu transposase C-terminal domain-containing protein n=1 Tax=Actinoplanes sp. NPDC051851 TaxID=3154753 RepID=UPI00342FF159
MIRLAADGLGVTERTVWRRLAAPASQARSRFQLSQTDRDAFVDFRGNVKAVHRARTAALAGLTTVAGVPIDDEFVQGWSGSAPVSLRTLCRAFAAELTPAAVAAAASGDRARRDKLVYLRRRGVHRNQVWEGDHKNLPILVLPPRGPATTPWVTMFVDDASRVIVGWAIALTPHAGTVLTALRMGMLPEDGGPASGVPGLLRLDGGMEFAADAVRAAANTLSIEIDQQPAYHANGKGKIERANRTVDQILLSMLPGFTEGPRDLDGRLSGPVDDRSAARTGYEQAAAGGAGPAELPLRLSVFVERFAAWVTWYNTEHVHTGVGGRTPAEAWTADPTPLRVVPEQHLRHLLLADADRTIQADGIHFRNLVFMCPAGLLRERRSQRVQLRYMPHDDRFVHVYLDGNYLTTCYPDNALSDEQTEQFYAAARAAERAAAAEKRSARRRGRRRLAALTGDDAPVEQSRLISPADVAALSAATVGTGTQAVARRAVSTSLLGIGPAVAFDEPVLLDDVLSSAGMVVADSDGEPW